MSTEMTPQRWENTCAYLREVFGTQDEQMATLMQRAAAAGLPEIAISADVGRLLGLLAGLTNAGRGPELAIELGTLAGYSTIWLARALAPGGRLITIELEDRHADFAQREFERAGVADRIRLVRGSALEVLPGLARELGPQSVDLAFLDAVKTEYLDYAQLLKPTLKRGGLLLADNVLGAGFWIDDPAGSSPDRDAIDQFNRAIAADGDYEASIVPIRQGILIARRR
jgi:predicted O-methyltransferase YrrM